MKAVLGLWPLPVSVTYYHEVTSVACSCCDTLRHHRLRATGLSGHGLSTSVAHRPKKDHLRGGGSLLVFYLVWLEQRHPSQSSIFSVVVIRISGRGGALWVWSPPSLHKGISIGGLWQGSHAESQPLCFKGKVLPSAERTSHATLVSCLSQVFPTQQETCTTLTLLNLSSS